MSQEAIPLRRMLMIGVGGSGGKTLRFVRRELRRRLLEVGFDNDYFPKSWQFIQVDAPRVADGSEAGLPSTLPANDYVGVAITDTPYDRYDESMVTKSATAAEAVAGWRPDPNKVLSSIDPTTGAGQLRAIGRVIYTAGISRVARRIGQAVLDLQSAEADEHHNQVQDGLGIKRPPGQKDTPLVVVVSSLSGGSGSGMFLDVCDLLRFMSARDDTYRWLREPYAILFAPDVFDELQDLARGGVEPNALAALSELMAGSWDVDAFNPSDQAFLVAAGVQGGVPGKIKRGPGYPFIVGRTNGEITLKNQVAVYRAMGTMLAVVASHPEVQSSLAAYSRANWTLTQQYGGDAPFLPAQPKSLSALGYASVGMGRDLFAQYASERLARACIERVLRAHHTDEVPQRVTPEAARDAVVDKHYELFVGACGLSERGTEHNQILDEIRHQQTVVDQMATERDALVAQLRRQAPVSPAEWASKIEGRVTDLRETFLGTCRREREANAKAWCESIQERVLATVARYTANYGLPVTVELLHRLVGPDGELSDVVAELGNEQSHHERQGVQVRGSAGRILGEWSANVLPPENELLRQATTESMYQLWWQSEADAAALTADVIADMRRGFLVPLHRTLADGLAALSRESTDEPSRISAFSLWPEYGVPDELRPPENEFLLESVDTYPKSFDVQVGATVGEGTFAAAETQVIEEIVTGLWNGRTQNEEPVTDQTVFELQRRWKTGVPALGAGREESALVDVHLTLTEVLRRAREWVYEPDRAIGAFVRETLKDYLDPGGSVSGAEADQRRQRFAENLRAAMGAAKPLAALDPVLVDQLYRGLQAPPQPIISPMPFPPHHPARAVAEEVLTATGVSAGILGDCFGQEPRATVHVSRLLAAPFDPVVFESLTGPIRASWARSQQGNGNRSLVEGFWTWRRAQQLDKFVPVPSDILAAMVRGWYTARLLDWASQYDEMSPEEQWVLSAKGETLHFPNPLLGTAPTTAFDVLPALLESLPLAMLDYSANRRETSMAYARLQDLGTSAQPGGQYVKANRELGTWIGQGTFGTGLTTPAPVKAGPVGNGPADEDAQAARKDASTTTLSLFLEDFNAAVEAGAPSDNPREYRLVERCWELRTVVRSAFGDLIHAVGSVQTGRGPNA